MITGYLVSNKKHIDSTDTFFYRFSLAQFKVAKNSFQDVDFDVGHNYDSLSVHATIMV